jgi:O-antigen ligase/tetratricopeptide (TPR) repeat protein
MAPTGSPQMGEHVPSPAVRPGMVSLVKGGMEAVLLLMITASPWVYGAVHPAFEFLLNVGLALLLALWGVRMVLEGEFTWQKCPVALCLAGLFLLGIWQTTSLPRSVLDWLSPATAQLYDQLLPSSPEILPMGMDDSTGPAPAGSTISLYPGATRKQTLRLLAIFLVFAVVRNNLVSVSVLRRLAVACVINGLFLALFAFVQFATSPRNMLYWTYPSMGYVFGPFICRNHFPFYLNLCIGLGVGLLLSTNTRGARNEEGADAHGMAPRSSVLAPLFRLLHHPAALWIAAALSLMVASVALSLSRGGLFALVGGLTACLLLRGLTTRRPFRPGLSLLIGGLAVAFMGGLAVALASWFGYQPIKARLGTVWEGEAFAGRLPVWSRVWPLAGEFPLFGTGFATFEQIEPMRRQLAVDGDHDANVVWEHAHNEYLEILVEGGLIGLSLGLLAIGLVYWLGYRALRRREGHSSAGLIFGALLSCTTMVIHNFVDFGLHVPAIALLTTVLCAQLAGLGSQDQDLGRRHGAHAIASGSQSYRLRFGGLAPFLGALTCLGLGWLLCAASWRNHRVDLLKIAATRANANTNLDGQKNRLGFLEKAAALDPEDAYLLLEMGQVRIGIYEKHPKENRALLLPALRDHLLARNACPFMPYGQLAIAAYRHKLVQADSRTVYLARAQLLAPCDPEIWYLSGLQELSANEKGLAGECWRHCLELSESYLVEILTRASSSFSSDELIRMVLPQRPELLLTAATRLYPEDEPGRKPFLQHALDLLAAQPGPLTGKDLRAKARVHQSLGQTAAMMAAYEALLALEPYETNWRLEFARILYDQGRLIDARRELLIVLDQQPQNTQARDMLTIVTRDLRDILERR